ncbi:glycoside hydrolase superfamily [Plectosphaerella plurivora]|uniref:beta-glucosidase n=1 Tax=Plectosphaerella plurivora TaxID=936078 RepID=A0A9P8VAY7_9PEZI|nr:glycoside hydrolase superfamily [Plectosphaerella plurivora]
MPSVDVDALLGQMTLEEKILLLAGKNFWETHEIPRLDIPSVKVTDGPSGARGETFIDGTPAACFPACVSLAATFDTQLARRVGRALAEETLTKGANVLLGPTICIHRSPLGGRNFEAFSEDPLLTGALATEYVKGLQHERVAPSVKHFFANEQDTRRFVLNEVISERAMREIYLKSFEIVVKDAKPWTLMSAYPKINGHYIDATSTWLTKVLRDEWKFDGLAMSDWGAASTVDCVANGLDLEMPGPARHASASKVRAALEQGSYSEADIDKRVRASLVLLERVGKFADRRPTPKEQAINKPEHRALIREAGAAGVVLLKNERGVLPIDAKKTKKIALLGPLADHASAHGGGSSFLTCHYKISPMEALKKRFGSELEITYSKGCEIYRSLPDFTQGVTSRHGEQGFDVDYFASFDATGEPIKHEFVRRGYLTTHDQIDVKATAMSARMSTQYTPTETGSHYLSISGAGVTQLFVDGTLVVSQDSAIVDAMAFIAGCQDEIKAQHPFEVGKTYKIEIITSMPTVSVSDSHILDKQLCAHVGFVPQAQMERKLQEESVALAKEAEVALVFVGNTHQWESEGQRHGGHDALITAVAAANPNTVVVANTGVPFEVPWLDDVAGFMQGWYAGQEVGNALVDVLMGKVSPSGRLPVSWPRSYEHTACYGNYGLDSMESKEVEYVEGVFVGYRHFDRHWGGEKEVLFPFGFGLSYAEFEVVDISVANNTECIDVVATVRNIGARDGAQTIQVYIAPPQDGTMERPVKELAGFAKVRLAPGQEDRVQVRLPKSAGAFWDETVHKWRVVSGSYGILVATSSHPDHVLKKGEVHVEQGSFFDP